MICVSIGRGRHKHVIAEHKHLVSQGARLVELRLDYINGAVNLRRLLPDRPGPVVISVRRAQDGGKYSESEEQRQILLRSAIAEGVDYVDLEEDIAGKIPRFGKTKRIVSHHDFRKTPDDLAEIHKRMTALDPDIIKIATLANCTEDNVRMLRLVRESKVPTIGLCMGDIGVPTRILTGRCGAPFTYATFSQERALAPGQLSFEQMRDLYRYDSINAETEVYGVIGDPIGHTLSPLIHNTAFAQAGLNKVYLPFRVAREDLESFIASAPEMGIRGLSVTIPHKEALLQHLTKVDGAVRGVGAANTVLFEDGDISGFNTDYRGAMDSLVAAMQLDKAGTFVDLTGVTALILGAGGAARAIAFGLKRRGANLLFASRSFERAEALANRVDGQAVDWQSRQNHAIDILVNCTPVGMHPNVDESPYPQKSLRSGSLVFDTVYNPENTLLIKEARDQGCIVVTGVEMFVRQAALQYRMFTGDDPPDDVMRETLKRAIAAARY